MEFYKKDRKGRLFVDVMRNAIGATLVAPYSLRGRERPTRVGNESKCRGLIRCVGARANSG